MGRLRRIVRRAPDDVEQTIEDLNDSELEWVRSNVEAASELVRIYTGAEERPVPSVALLDDGFAAWLEAWHGQQEADRDDPNANINVFGLAFGQQLVDGLGFEWKVVGDSDGTEMAVVGQPGDVIVFPPNLVAKRFVARETRFLEDVYEEIAWTCDRLRRGEDPTAPRDARSP